MLSGIDPCDIVKEKIRQNPKNFMYRLLEAALHQEQNGNIKRALFLYTCCKSDDFAKSRIQALSPLKFALIAKDSPEKQNPSKTSLTDILSNDEYQVFKVMLAIRKRKAMLKRETIVQETGYSKEKVFAALQGLQKKGYIGKLEMRYRHIQILKHPVSQNGVMGTLENNSNSQAKKPLTFSFSKVKPQKEDREEKASLWSDSSLESIESSSERYTP